MRRGTTTLLAGLVVRVEQELAGMEYRDYCKEELFYYCTCTSRSYEGERQATDAVGTKSVLTKHSFSVDEAFFFEESSSHPAEVLRRCTCLQAQKTKGC